MDAKRKSNIYLSSLDEGLNEADDETADRGGSDLTGNVGAYGVHEKMIGRVFLNSHFFDDSGRHGECRDTCRAHHGIDFIFREEVHDLRAHDAADRIEYEREQPERHDHQRFPLHELIRLHLERDRDSEKERDDVGKGVLGGVGQGTEHAAFADEVAEHQHAHEGERRRSDKSRYDRNDDGEQNSRQLIDLPCVTVHFDTAFLLRRTQFHHGGLHDGNERHIRIRHDHDRTDIIGSKFHRNENRRRAVRRADDCDGRRVCGRKSDERRQNERNENTELSSSAQNEHLRIRKQRAEIDHGADADE